MKTNPPPLPTKSFWKKNLKWGLIVLGVVLYATHSLLIKTYIVQAFKIPSGAMVPTLLVGDHIITDKTFDPVEVKHGDIIVFQYPKNHGLKFVKRVIGKPGNEILVRAKKIYINKNLLEENYVIHLDPGINPDRDHYGPVTVPADSLFVMGDNRDASNDSRFFGFVHFNEVVAKVTYIYWSWDAETSSVRWERVGKKIE